MEANLIMSLEARVEVLEAEVAALKQRLAAHESGDPRQYGEGETPGGYAS